MKILICGENGSGKSTLGKKISQKLNYKFMDIEDYYFNSDDTNYKYESHLTKVEVTKKIVKDIKENNNLVFAAVKFDYGENLVNDFDVVIYINVPLEIRMKRIKERSYQKFGDRILLGSDLYEKENRFFDKVRTRPHNEVKDFLNTLSIPIIEIDGTKEIASNILYILKKLNGK